jgi:hypothetical protein
MLPNENIRIGRACAAIVLAGCAIFGSVDTSAAQARLEPVSPAAAPAASQTPASLDSLTVTRDRPLFSPSRRPPPAAMEVVAAPPPPPRPAAPAVLAPPPNLLFFGTFESNDQLGAAVQILPSDKPTILRYGQRIGDWRVTEISSYRLVLSLDERTVDFNLFASKQSNGAPNPGLNPNTNPVSDVQEPQVIPPPR